MGLIQREIESRDIPTVSITLSREMTEKVRPPRAVFMPFPLGHPLGRPNDVEMQRRVLLEALNALETITEPATILQSGLTYEGEACAVCDTNDAPQA